MSRLPTKRVVDALPAHAKALWKRGVRNLSPDDVDELKYQLAGAAVRTGLCPVRRADEVADAILDAALRRNPSKLPAWTRTARESGRLRARLQKYSGMPGHRDLTEQLRLSRRLALKQKAKKRNPRGGRDYYLTPSGAPLPAADLAFLKKCAQAMRPGYALKYTGWEAIAARPTQAAILLAHKPNVEHAIFAYAAANGGSAARYGKVPAGYVTKRNPRTLSDDAVIKLFLSRQAGSSKYLRSDGRTLTMVGLASAVIAEWADSEHVRLGTAYGNVSQSYIRKVAKAAPWRLTRESWWALPAKTVKLLKREGR